MILQLKKTNLSQAIICDACATAYTEEICDQLTSFIQLQTLPNKLTKRFSPGYGDFALESQKIFINLLNAPKYIGLTLNQENLMLPTKSVTAIIGILNDNENLSSDLKEKIFSKTIPNECKGCRHATNCFYLNRGQQCEYSRKTS